MRRRHVLGGLVGAAALAAAGVLAVIVLDARTSHAGATFVIERVEGSTDGLHVQNLTDDDLQPLSARFRAGILEAAKYGTANVPVDEAEYQSTAARLDALRAPGAPEWLFRYREAVVRIVIARA